LLWPPVTLRMRGPYPNLCGRLCSGRERLVRAFGPSKIAFQALAMVNGVPFRSPRAFARVYTHSRNRYLLAVNARRVPERSARDFASRRGRPMTRFAVDRPRVDPRSAARERSPRSDRVRYRTGAVDVKTARQARFRKLACEIRVTRVNQPQNHRKSRPTKSRRSGTRRPRFKKREFSLR